MKIQYIIFSLYILLNCCVYAQSTNIRTPFPSYLHELNADELQLLDQGFNYARSRGALRYYANLHSRHFGGAHNDPFEFFPFHGKMVDDMNVVLQEYDERLKIPVWDVVRQPVYPEEFYIMTRNWPEITRVRQPNTPINRGLVSMMANVNYNTNYLSFISYCSFVHNEIHNNYGGTFGSPISPLDPMFWSFHAYWEEQYNIWIDINGASKSQSRIL